MSDMQPFTDSSNLLTTPNDLRHQMQTDGYLFLPGLLQQEPIHTVYEAIMDLCKESRWADGKGKSQGTPIIEGTDAFWAVYDPLQKLACFHALAQRPELLHLIELLVQETPFAHPRNIARIVPPQTEHYTTPAHQDFVHIQGTPQTYTIWFPLHDCPQSLGSLVVLAGSHRELLPVHRAIGAGGLGVETADLELPWHGSDFAVGDVLLFHSYTVHKALPNRSAEQIRISVDYRYQGVSQPIVADGLEPHYGRLTWEQIYEEWTEPALQYYWRDLHMTLAERDRSFHKNAKENV